MANRARIKSDLTELLRQRRDSVAYRSFQETLPSQEELWRHAFDEAVRVVKFYMDTGVNPRLAQSRPKGPDEYEASALYGEDEPRRRLLARLVLENAPELSVTVSRTQVVTYRITASYWKDDEELKQALRQFREEAADLESHALDDVLEVGDMERMQYAAKCVCGIVWDAYYTEEEAKTRLRYEHIKEVVGGSNRRQRTDLSDPSSTENAYSGGPRGVE